MIEQVARALGPDATPAQIVKAVMEWSAHLAGGRPDRKKLAATIQRADRAIGDLLRQLTPLIEDRTRLLARGKGRFRGGVPDLVLGDLPERAAVLNSAQAALAEWHAAEQNAWPLDPASTGRRGRPRSARLADDLLNYLRGVGGCSLAASSEALTRIAKELQAQHPTLDFTAFQIDVGRRIARANDARRPRPAK